MIEKNDRSFKKAKLSVLNGQLLKGKRKRAPNWILKIGFGIQGEENTATSATLSYDSSLLNPEFLPRLFVDCRGKPTNGLGHPRIDDDLQGITEWKKATTTDIHLRPTLE